MGFGLLRLQTWFTFTAHQDGIGLFSTQSYLQTHLAFIWIEKSSANGSKRERFLTICVLCAHRHCGTSKQVMGTEPFQSAEMKLALEGNLISCLKFRRGPHHGPLPGSGPTLERVLKTPGKSWSCEFLINKTTAKIEHVWETEDRLTFSHTTKLKLSFTVNEDYYLFHTVLNWTYCTSQESQEPH